jgi:hypothetical protein
VYECPDPDMDAIRSEMKPFGGYGHCLAGHVGEIKSRRYGSELP